MEAIVPYLMFEGNAAEALVFYANCLGGEIVFSQTYGESPMQIPEEYKDRIMHATLKAGELTLMCSDGMPGSPLSSGTNVSLSLNFNVAESLDKTFESLAEGGKITMPVENTFWGARFGMLTDKYGINWMFNHDVVKKDK